MQIAPSILNLERDNYDPKLNDFLNAGIKILHLDIMDGIFVPNNTLDKDMLNTANKYPFILDSHLMVKDPLSYLEEYKNNGTTYFTFHYEAVDDVKETIAKIKEAGLKVGISIKPNTKVDVLDKYLSNLDLILIMSVEPGFGGQKFMDSAIDKIKYLNDLRSEKGYKYLIEIDGGINLDIARTLSKVHPDILVMGTYLLKVDNVKEIVDEVNKL